MRKNKKWTYELLHKTALMYETRNDFKKGSPNAYWVCIYRGILDEICGHMEGTPYVKWTDEMLFAKAREYKTRNDFKKGSPNAYYASQRRGIINAVCSHMEGNIKWTDEMLREEALQYKTRYEFKKANVNAYNACRYHKILDEVCSHMEHVLTYWSDEMLFEEALQYKTRYEFKKANVNAYNACRQRDILEAVCSHMKKPPHRKKPHCVYLIEIFTVTNELFYYVGQTSNLEDRLNKHFHNKSSKSLVFEFINKTPIIYKKHYIVKENLTFKESLKLEREKIKDLKDRGIKLLNKELL